MTTPELLRLRIGECVQNPRSNTVWEIEDVFLDEDPKSKFFQQQCYLMKSKSGTSVCPKDQIHTPLWTFKPKDSKKFISFFDYLMLRRKEELEEKGELMSVSVECPLCSKEVHFDGVGFGPICPNCDYLIMISVCKGCSTLLDETDYKCPSCGKLAADGVSEEVLRKHRQKRCEVCDTSAVLNVCGNCGTVRYCSIQCQKSDWNSHKTRCHEPETEELRAIPFVELFVTKRGIQRNLGAAMGVPPTKNKKALQK
jgi:predicted RNA-binding Zn-ribbon protein involved in translation (DUF1610 family)